MNSKTYLRQLVEDFHSTVVATIENNLPQTRVIDLMLWDEKGLYFLTAKGKSFYHQLMNQGYIALSATKDQQAISFHGKVKNIHQNKLNEIFEKNTYMKKIYPKDSREALEVFCIYEGEGEYFDLRNPSHIFRESFSIGIQTTFNSRYIIDSSCTHCKKCISLCPQHCISDSIQIQEEHCLHCGRCIEYCPNHSIKERKSV